MVSRSFDEEGQILISAATITAELSAVREIARDMSLGVMNAKAISARAGDAARGFRPITDFIDEMAGDVMRLEALIAQKALEVSRIAVDRNRARTVLRHLRRVLEGAGDLPNAASLRAVFERLDREAVAQQDGFIENIHRLDELLEEINQRVRAAQVISANSRVEASRAQRFRQNLEVVADNLEQATDRIRAHVGNSRRRLSDVMAGLRRGSVG